ncbi:DUF1877 family protein [Aquimarina sp. 2304DJ70-9]|uniref:DUF1877 family protein n=1 Tax=Aquimarina penaris TaxID=3231044 RepID=UPI0034622068
MGIICELYRISDSEIEELKKIQPEVAEEFLDENYASIYGKYHKENDTVFSMDKGWAVTRFLIQECDISTNKVLSKLDDQFIKSDDVKLIHKMLELIRIEDLQNVYDQKKLIENNIYRAKYDFYWEYIDNYHLKIYKSGFKRASELNDGIAINYN